MNTEQIRQKVKGYEEDRLTRLYFNQAINAINDLSDKGVDVSVTKAYIVQVYIDSL